MSKRISKQESIEIINLYKTGKYNAVEIGNMFNITNSGVLKLVKRHGYYLSVNQSELQRKYSINENYFNKIDNEYKAYYLGLLYADGYNSESKRSLRLTLQEEDKDILDKFNLDICNNRPLKFRKKEKSSHKNYWILDIYNKQISKDLARLGCIQAKSLKISFPDTNIVPSRLIHHFIRGMIDGDGSIAIYNNISSVKLTTTKMFCDGLSKVLAKLKINFTIREASNKNGINYVLSIKGGLKANIKFLNWIYKDATVYLHRKYNKYLEITNL